MSTSADLDASLKLADFGQSWQGSERVGLRDDRSYFGRALLRRAVIVDCDCGEACAALLELDAILYRLRTPPWPGVPFAIVVSIVGLLLVPVFLPFS